MNKVATTLILGGIIGAAGAGYLANTNSTKRKLMRKGKQAMHKAERVLDDVKSDIW